MLENIKEWLAMMRASSYVERVHTVQTIDRQTLGHHGYNVAVIALAITDGEASGNLLKACLFHDAHEVEHGDAPAQTSWANEDLRKALKRMMVQFRNEYNLNIELTMEEEHVLAWADKLEFVYYCLEQINMGNRNMIIPFSRGMDNISSSFTHVGRSKELWNDLIKQAGRFMSVQILRGKI
jgi:5'-deoxynucleotidase YfbR-like HD superfamily hydrolase